MSASGWWLSGVACILAGATLLYLAAPHQKLTRRPRHGRAMAAVGVLALAGAAVPLARPLSGAAAVFTVATVAMLLWSVPPLLIALARRDR